MLLSVRYQFTPKRPSVSAAQVMDHFGVAFEQGEHVIADNLEVPVNAGEIVLFTGASGSGKSSLMRELARQVGREAPVVSLDDLVLPDALLVDALGLSAQDAMQLLSACGLGEAHLMLRTPAELSDGQRYRFRLALALSRRPSWIVADEFTATLDRTLARVIAFNLRRLADRTGTGFLLATTHDDVEADLDPDVHLHCRLDGETTLERRSQSPSSGPAPKKKRTISFAEELWLSAATRRDWPYFARWHYRSHHLGLTRQLVMLWHGEEPIGICVFVSPPISLRLRNEYFGRSGRWSRAGLKVLNRQVALLQRVVVHPTYRGAGISAAFVRRACELTPWPWIETLTQMGRINPFFEKAGFVRVGSVAPRSRTRREHSALYGGKRKQADQGLVTRETFEKSRFACPVYYIFDNRNDGRTAKESSERRD